MSRPPLALHVDRTWQGLPVPLAEVATLRLERDGAALRLDLEAPFHDDPPPAEPPGPTDRLWLHEVVELFVARRMPDGLWHYLEVELGPHGHHLVLRLEGVRQAVARCLPLDFVARVDGVRWHGEAAVPLVWLPGDPDDAFGVAGFAIHGTDAARRYLASTPLPGAAPDFHQPAQFPLLRF